MIDSTDWKFRFFKGNPYCRRQLRAYREACGVFGYQPVIVESSDFFTCFLKTQSKDDRDSIVRYVHSRF